MLLRQEPVRKWLLLLSLYFLCISFFTLFIFTFFFFSFTWLSSIIFTSLPCVLFRLTVPFTLLSAPPSLLEGKVVPWVLEFIPAGRTLFSRGSCGRAILLPQLGECLCQAGVTTCDSGVPHSCSHTLTDFFLPVLRWGHLSRSLSLFKDTIEFLYLPMPGKPGMLRGADNTAAVHTRGQSRAENLSFSTQQDSLIISLPLLLFLRVQLLFPTR